MNAEKINEVIANHIGWEKGIVVKSYGKPDRRQDWGWTPPREWLYSKSPSAQRYLNDLQNGNMAGPPDYCGDLNAMREAEFSLWCDEVLVEQYRETLENVYLKAVGYSGAGYWFMAGAPQRAEAFLRTVGKWEEE